MSLFIEALDGTEYDLEQYGLIPQALRVESLSPRTISEEIDGRDGHVDIETTYEGRSLRAFFKLKGNDVTEYLQFRNAVHKLFDGKSYFYVTDQNEPTRRWKVKSATRFDLERINPSTGKFELELISVSPFSESVFSTLNTDNRYGYSQVSTSEPAEYVFTTTSFSVWNDGDVTIDPRVAPLKIEFTGASTNLSIQNVTTGEEWSYTGTTIANDVIVLNGIRSLKNDGSIFGDTNRKVLTLSPGWNDFIITGASDPFEISFDFRFYYI